MRKRLNYANVVSTLALVLAVGTGGAWAATTIHGKLIKKNTVTGNKLKKNTLGTREVNETKLGKVPSAELATNSSLLGGTGPEGFVRGGGSHSTGRTSVPAGDNPNVVKTFQTPVGEFRLGCGNANADVRYFNTTPGSADVFRFHFRGAGDDDTNFDVVPENGDVGYAATDAIGAVFFDLRAGKGEQVAVLRVGQRRAGTTCIFTWELVTP